MMFLDFVSELSNKYHIIKTHTYDNRQVYSIEDLLESNPAHPPKPDVVYFVYDLSLVHNRKLPSNLIFCGDATHESEQLIANAIQIDIADMNSFLSDASIILHSNYKMQNIYIQMMDAIVRGKGISGMLENIGTTLNTSVVIIDMSGKILSYSKPFKVEEPIWNDSILKGYCPPFFIEHIRDVKSQHDSESGDGPFLRNCIDNHLFYLSNRIILHGELYGYVFMIQSEDNFDPLCYSVLPMITRMVSDIILQGKDINAVRTRVVSDFMTDLLNGIPLEQIQARIDAAQIEFPKCMVLALLKPLYFSTESHIQQKLCPKFQEVFPAVQPICYENSIVSLIPLPENMLELQADVLQALQTFCTENDLIAGLSNPYSKISNTRSCYQQAKKALRSASVLEISGTVFPYRDYAFYDLADLQSDLQQLDLCCHPVLSILRKYDHANGTQLYKTLETLTYCGFNNHQTASELFLHRNTLSYRLQKINSLTGLDFEDPDVRFELQYSFRLARYIFHANQKRSITGLASDR